MDIQKMIDSYAEWLKNEIHIAEIGEYYEITTPFLDRFNDYLQIYVKQNHDGSILLTDDGYIIDNLISSGVPIKKNSSRQLMIEHILNTYSMKLEDQKIVATATLNTFPQIKHMFVQALLTIDDMFVSNTESVKNFFVEDVESYFKNNEIFYSKDFSLIGKTGSIYNYDFHFQRTRQYPERFCKTINKLNESNRNLTIFNWIDTQEKRNNEGKLIVIINDENDVSFENINAFTNYGIQSLKFSEREQHVDMFAS
jgi:hypothetical protein